MRIKVNVKNGGAYIIIYCENLKVFGRPIINVYERKGKKRGCEEIRRNKI